MLRSKEIAEFRFLGLTKEQVVLVLGCLLIVACLVGTSALFFLISETEAHPTGTKYLLDKNDPFQVHLAGIDAQTLYAQSTWGEIGIAQGLDQDDNRIITILIDLPNANAKTLSIPIGQLNPGTNSESP